MDALFAQFSMIDLLCAGGIAVLAGFVKGVVGFAMPLVLISGLTLFMSPQEALAGLILPTLASNLFQSLRQGTTAAVASIKTFWVFLAFGGVTLAVAAQFVLQIPDDILKGALGLVITCFVVLQLSGYGFTLRRQSRLSDAVMGAVTGMLGGLFATWGAPTVAYLTALDTPKQDQMRIQGVIYGLGAVALLGAHIGSGVLNSVTWLFSALLILPALAGMWLGGGVSDRFDQKMFKRATLVVLLIAGLNLMRRALI